MVNASPRRNKRQEQKDATANVSRTMRVVDVVALVPGAERVLAEYGIHCAHCSIGGIETLEEGCALHGFDSTDVDLLVEDLNALLAEGPVRPATLTITEPAAAAIRSVMEKEGRADEQLVVSVDVSGGFCMEFTKDAPREAQSFAHSSQPDVHVFALPLTLRRIGGSTIDYREGRFKLDLPDA